MGRLLVVLALVAAACGGDPAAETVPAGAVADPATTTFTAAAPSSAETTAPATNPPTDEPTRSGTDGSEATARARPQGPDAPDFVLALGQGGEFSLSAEQKPVYLVFWAEW